MALCNFSYSPLSLSSIPFHTSSASLSFSPPRFHRHCGSSSSSSVSAASQMMDNERPRLTDYPYASPPIKDLMVDLISTVESGLDTMLLPCSLPQDVEYFENQSGTSHASLLLRSGSPSSP